jgi:large subunit ribosomal protein L30
MTEKKTPTKRTKPAPTKRSKPSPAKVLSITLVRSPIGATYRHKATLRALGLKHMNQTVQQAKTPQLEGMLAKVGHMVKVEAGSGKETTS